MLTDMGAKGKKEMQEEQVRFAPGGGVYMA